MTTLMEQEALSAHQVIETQLLANQKLLSDIVHSLKKNQPKFIVTIARGSSDHAATFAKYLFETKLGIVTASAAPSVCTLYEANLNFKNALVIAISQSGQSPDIAELLNEAKKGGATTIAFVNMVNSPIAKAAEFIVPLYAGDEKAVAATKSYLATLSALTQFVALWSDDKSLQDALTQLPQRLHEACQMDWSQAIDVYKDHQNTLVVARGYGYAIAQEAALKFKETANIHAEAFSSAELLHGPFALVQKDFPIFLFGQHDASLSGILELGIRIKTLGGNVLIALPEKAEYCEAVIKVANIVLPMPKTLHPILDPLLVVQAFYLMIARLSVARGLNPDKPNNLTKVTQTW